MDRVHRGLEEGIHERADAGINAKLTEAGFGGVKIPVRNPADAKTTADNACNLPIDEFGTAGVAMTRAIVALALLRGRDRYHCAHRVGGVRQLVHVRTEQTVVK